MKEVTMKTHCEECGNDAFLKVLTNGAVIIEFLEDTPFTCGSCERNTYLDIEKRIEVA